MDALVTIRIPGLASSHEAQTERRASSQPVPVAAEPSDEDLLLLVSRGDQEALASLFRRYARVVRGLAYRVLRDAAEADDLLQDIFLLVYRLSRSFDPSKGTARTWILQITYRRAISRRRYLTTRHFYNRVDLDEAVEHERDPLVLSGTSDQLAGLENITVLRRALEELPENQRRTLALFFFEGYTFSEIAAKLGQREGNVRHHYYRGLDRLRKLVFSGKLPGRKAV